MIKARADTARHALGNVVVVPPMMVMVQGLLDPDCANNDEADDDMLDDGRHARHV